MNGIRTHKPAMGRGTTFTLLTLLTMTVYIHSFCSVCQHSLQLKQWVCAVDGTEIKIISCVVFFLVLTQVRFIYDPVWVEELIEYLKSFRAFQSLSLYSV